MTIDGERASEDIRVLLGSESSEAVGDFSEKIQGFVRGEIEAVFDGSQGKNSEDIEAEVQQGVLDVQVLSENGDFCVTTLNGEPVAMMGVQIGGRLDDGREVYRVRMVYTEPDFRGRGIYPQMQHQFFEYINQKYDNPPLIACTQSESVAKGFKKQGWIKISSKDHANIKAKGEDLGVAPWDLEADKDGIQWQNFLYDPQKQQ